MEPHTFDAMRKRKQSETNESADYSHSKRMKYEQECKDEEDVWPSKRVDSNAETACILVLLLLGLTVIH